MLWAPFDVGVHRAAHTHFYFYAMRGTGGREEVEEWEMEGGVFKNACACFLGGYGKAWMKDEDGHTPLFLLPSLSFPGGLYGWKWGVLSATSLTQTVPSALSQDQPERGEADNHWHRGSVPHREATHSPGLPHGELHSAEQLCVYPRCGGSLWAPEVARCCSVWVDLLLNRRAAVFLFYHLCFALFDGPSWPWVLRCTMSWGRVWNVAVLTIFLHVVLKCCFASSC